MGSRGGDRFDRLHASSILAAMQVTRNPYQTAKLFAKWALFVQYQLQVLNRMSHVLMVAERDAANVRILSPRLDIRVIPNGVDADYFTPARTMEGATQLSVSSARSGHVRRTRKPWNGLSRESGQ